VGGEVAVPSYFNNGRKSMSGKLIVRDSDFPVERNEAIALIAVGFQRQSS
jgi:hypothetical protein